MWLSLLKREGVVQLLSPINLRIRVKSRVPTQRRIKNVKCKQVVVDSSWNKENRCSCILAKRRLFFQQAFYNTGDLKINKHRLITDVHN